MKEKGRFTPGPWKLNEDWTIRSQEIKNSTQMADYKGSIICSLMEAHGGRYHAFSEAEANARLIAAAPELLEACKLVCKFYQDNFDIMPVAFQTVNDICEEAIKDSQTKGETND